MARSRQETFELMVEAEKPSKCIGFLRFLWKFFRCVFSHVSLVSLVVLYCVIGAYTFEALEANHEKEIKRNIKDIRGNVAEQLWKITKEVEVLIRENWTEKALRELKSFENSLVWVMEKEGWNGSEGEDDIQWTFAGALFYSIVVITTIGYGHIAPKTKNGKVVTIFYAILGIPLMLLCLSNIGDVMASSFRFLYWRVCCYICTKPPTRRRRPRTHFGRSYSVRQAGRYGASRGGFRRSIRTSDRSADSVLGLYEFAARSSFPDVDHKYNVRRYGDNDQKRPNPSYPSSMNRNFGSKSATVSRYSDLAVSTPKTPRAIPSPKMTTQSLDRKLLMRSPTDTDRSAVLCNKYALDDLENELRRWRTSAGSNIAAGKGSEANDAGSAERTRIDSKDAPSATRSLPRRCLSMEGATTNYKRSLASAQRPSSFYLEAEYGRRGQSTKGRRYRSNYPVARPYRRESLAPELVGYAGHRQIYPDEFDSEYEYYTGDDQERQPIKPVPIWLCVFLVVSYIFGGAFLFSAWEHWPFLDSAYFCFITLTTIGFGDFVPAYKLDAHKGIAVCSLYLLFGIALLAMSFNLVQEEVINNVKNVAKRLGIIKESDDEEEAEDYDAYDVEYNDEVDNEELEGYVLDSPRCHSMPRNSRGISVA